MPPSKRNSDPTEAQVDAWLARHAPLPDGTILCHMCGQKERSEHAVAVVGLGWLCSTCHVRAGG